MKRRKLSDRYAELWLSHRQLLATLQWIRDTQDGKAAMRAAASEVVDRTLQDLQRAGIRP